MIDIIILLCLGWGAYKGFKKGFIIQSFVILALILAIWGGFAFAGKLEPFMQKHFQMSELVCSIISFIIVFLLILTLVYTSGYLVSKVADSVALGMINRLAGAAFGIFANALILSVLILLFNRVNGQKRFIESETLEKTYLYQPVGKAAPAIFPEKFFKIFQFRNPNP
jgi:membrane protein required for colicin V production